MISVLDCTLRDGGYINNWNFGKHTIKKICDLLQKAYIEIIEVGFLTDLPHSKDHSLFSSCAQIAEVCPNKGKSMLAAMIALGEKELDPSVLPLKEDSCLDIVRITFHRNEEEIERAEKYAAILMEKGYKVCMQPVGTTTYSDKELINLLERVNQLSPYAFYLVDTLGTLCNDELMRFIYLIDNNLDKNIKLGFHSHNNLQMSFSNAQEIIDCHSSRDFIIDCSLFGMGRGAGNLCTELITRRLNELGIANYSMLNILEAIDSHIYPIFLKSGWGYNAHYYMAAIHKCHPNYATYLMEKQTLTMNQVDFLLQNLPKDTRHIYDSTLIERLYQNLQRHSINDDDETHRLSAMLNKRTVLLIAPGKSITLYSDKIKDFIKKKQPVIFSVNCSPESYPIDYAFVSNNKRMQSLDYDTINHKIIITSNLPKISEKFVCVDYDSLCDFTADEPDNAGIMLIRLMANVGVSDVYLAGYDGFDPNPVVNYYSGTMVTDIDFDKSKAKNTGIKLQISQLKKRINIHFITPSYYETGSSI